MDVMFSHVHGEQVNCFFLGSETAHIKRGHILHLAVSKIQISEGIGVDARSIGVKLVVGDAWDFG